MFGTLRVGFEVPHDLPGHTIRDEMLITSSWCPRRTVQHHECDNQPETQHGNNSIDRWWCLRVILGGWANFSPHTATSSPAISQCTKEVQKMCFFITCLKWDTSLNSLRRQWMYSLPSSVEKVSKSNNTQITAIQAINRSILERVRHLNCPFVCEIEIDNRNKNYI